MPVRLSSSLVMALVVFLVFSWMTFHLSFLFLILLVSLRCDDGGLMETDSMERGGTGRTRRLGPKRNAGPPCSTDP